MKKINSLLYIEDDLEVRENISEYFEHHIENVYLAKDGIEGLESFKKYSPQVVVSDISMPKLNGIELLKKIRTISSSTQFIITTSYDNQEYLIEAINLQITNYILKPLSITSLGKSLKLCEQMTIDPFESVEFFSKEIYFDKFKKELYKNKEIIPLTRKERELLELLLKTSPSPLSYEQIYLNLYDNIPSKDAVKTLVKMLRRKISYLSIKTMYGYGYKLFLHEEDIEVIGMI